MTSHFKGPVESDNGFVGAITGNITGNVTGNITGNVTGNVTGDVTGDVTGNVTGNVTGSVSAGITSGATATEINTRCDDSAMVDTRTGAGAISVTTAYTALVTTAADTITLAAPSKPAFIKVIKMTTDGGDGTLAMTNIINALGAETTSITFDDVNDVVVLVSDAASGKWVLIANDGCTLA